MEIGTWTDTAFAEYGAAFGCAVSYCAHVVITPLERPGFAITTTNTFPHDGDAFIRALANEFGVDGFKISLEEDQPSAPGAPLSPAAAVALTGAFAHLAQRFLTPHQIATLAHRIHHENVANPSGVHAYIVSALGGVILCEISPFPRTFPSILSLDAQILQAFEQRVFLVRSEDQAYNASYEKIAQNAACGKLATREALWRLRAFPRLAADAVTAGDFSTLEAVMRSHHQVQRQLLPCIVTPPYQQLTAIVRQHQAVISAAHPTGSLATVLCSPDRKTELEENLRRASFSVLEAKIDHSGLRVWGHDPDEERQAIPDDATLRAA